MTEDRGSPTAFAVVPFEPDGGYPFAGPFRACSSLLLAAAALAFPAYWVASALPEIEWVVTLALGGALAGVGWQAVARSRLRNPPLATLIGFLAGALGVAALHYWDYQERLTGLEAEVWPAARDRLTRELFPAAAAPLPRAFNRDPRRRLKEPVLPPRVAAAVDAVARKRVEKGWPRGGDVPADLENEVQRAVHQAVEEIGFGEYLSWRATQGTPVFIPKAHDKLVLGRLGSFILWGLEAALAGLLAGAAMAVRARRPFCLECQTWKTTRQLGRLRLPAELARDVFEAGEVRKLDRGDFTPAGGPIRLTVATCPRCGDRAPVEVKVEEVTLNDKNAEVAKELAHLTYPGEALPVLEGLAAPRRAAGAAG